ncbi:MAG: prolyl oligopeptidase family serine peptidase [Cytophagales bacterium]|nr:prolyl oligopeptidase family serine peptidase [Rhizobacter sp.]
MKLAFSFAFSFAFSQLRHAALALALGGTALAAFAQTTLPTAAVRNVTDTHFGTKVDDPYRYFENKADPDVAKWMKAHSDHAYATLARIPGRNALLEKIQKYDSATSDRIAQVTRLPGDLYFLERRSATENQFKLYMRQGVKGADKLLVDPEALEKKTGKPHAINWYTPSPDGSLVAYGLSAQGSEAAVLHLLNTRTGKPVGTPIPRADFGGVDWSPDGKSFVFNRLRAQGKGAKATDKYQNSQTLLLRPGERVAAARSVFGTDVKGVKIGAAEIPVVSFSHDGQWAFGYVINGTQREQGLYVAPQAGVLLGKPAWKRVLSSSDDVTSIAYFGGTLYLVSHKSAPRSQVLSLKLGSPDLKSAEVVMPASDRVVVNVVAAADAIYVETRDGNVKRLFKRAHGASGAPVEVKLPLEGSFELSNSEGGVTAANPRLPGVIIDLQSWNSARQVYLVAADGSVANTGLQPAGTYDTPQGIVTTEVKVKSHDGALVPLSIIHRDSVKLDGSNPTILYGYASYGITEEPFYSVSRLAWLDAGGVYAIANPRGTSVYGEEWYRGGYQATKPNTWKDFIACAEYLIAQKYTQASKLGILGGSAGGILVGRAMTERPDLFAAVIPAVGALDMIRMETTANGVPNIPEFGSTKTEAGFKALLAMSTYANIKPGTPYPAVMLTHGVNDPRVEVWESTKAAALLMASTNSGKPVLMRLAYDAGHGVGNTKKQQLEERADMFAFFLWQMGVPGFQPPPP